MNIEQLKEQVEIFESTGYKLVNNIDNACYLLAKYDNHNSQVTLVELMHGQKSPSAIILYREELEKVIEMFNLKS